MNPVHLHLLLNHLPVVGTVIATGLLAYALLRGSTELTRASLGLFVLFALLAVVVFLTGEPAEELVEGLPGVSEAILERHEEVARVATVLLGALGLVATGGLVAFRRRPEGIPRRFAALALALALVPTVALGYTANLGGQIRHPEIRPAQISSGEAGAEARTGKQVSEPRTTRRDDD